MRETGPTRGKSDLADMVEMLLDKGVVINADIAVSVGDTQLLGIEVRAAIASFETAAKYGLEFPAGTDEELIEQAASGRTSLEGVDRDGSTDRDDSSDEGGGAAPRGRSVTPTPEVAPRVATEPATGGNAPGVEDRGEADDRPADDRGEAASDDEGADVETGTDGEADARPRDHQGKTDDHDDDD